MPSRKKAKGKARKAAKEAKAKAAEAAKESQAVEAAAGQRHLQEEPLEAQMQRLMVNAPSPTMCRHGCPPLPADEDKICCDFINSFITTAFSRANVAEGFSTAHEFTEETYADMYDSKLDTVVTKLFFLGTQMILYPGDNLAAQLCAAFAFYFEEWIACEVRKTKADINWTKVHELRTADDHTLVKFYRKRIPCSCLDKKYKQVKSVKKMGLCYNPNCSHPEGKVERSKMFSCTRCGAANYCSVECQRADWKEHRKECDKGAKLKAAFEWEE